MVLSRRRLLVALGLAAAGVALFVLLYFEPQKLFIDDRVDEALPVAAPAAAGAPAAAPARPAVRTLAHGRFRSYEHSSRGRVRVIELADGRRYVRFEDFRTSNGPALKVYLSAAPASGPGDAFDDRYLDLGDLKGNIGNQNYRVARSVDLGRYRSVVVWCDRFSVAFAAAPLGSPG
jgi:hypothetical protein